MIALRSYRSADLPGLAEIWNATFLGGPNFVRVDVADLRRRVVDQPSFAASGLLAAAREGEVRGFVHFGPRTNLWSQPAERRADPSEGHIYALVAGAEAGSLAGDLLTAAVERLKAAGARRVLLGPSWIHGTQPFYNGIAGAYEMPGLTALRRGLVELAAGSGFAPAAEYGTPELDLTDTAYVAGLRATGADIWERVEGLGLRQHTRHIESSFFPARTLIELTRGRESLAMAAYGPWPEYARQYGRRLFGITNVHVTRQWRGRGLGKLIMIRAVEAALHDGAEALHLHVWRENAPAWNLYHTALDFRPKYEWLTLRKDLG